MRAPLDRDEILYQHVVMSRHKPSPHRKAANDYVVLGITSDGVAVLKPRFKATHFTDEEIREAILKARTALGIV